MLLSDEHIPVYCLERYTFCIFQMDNMFIDSRVCLVIIRPIIVKGTHTTVRSLILLVIAAGMSYQHLDKKSAPL